MAVSNPSPTPHPRPPDGGALFIAATLVIGVVAIAVLDRVGAPQGFVRALGPALALAVFGGAGLSVRNADLTSFLASGRRLDAFRGALALLLIVAGLAVCLYGQDSKSGLASWPFAVAGVAAGVFGLGPLLRRFGATWRSDVIATRFPGWPVRAASGLALVATAALTAYAGFRGATGVLLSEAGVDRTQAEAIVALTLALGSVPGGLASLLASAAAGSGAFLAMLGAAIFLKGALGPAAISAPVDGLQTATGLASALATGLAVGGFFALDPPAIASRSIQSSLRSARGTLLLCLALGAAILSIAPGSAPIEVTDAAIGSLTGGAAVTAFLAVACVGAQGCSRAFGIVLNTPPRPFPTLASVRLARMRGVQLLAIAACIAANSHSALDAPIALVAAMAISLAFTLPLLALAAIPRAGSRTAGAALIAGIAVFAYRLRLPLELERPGALLNSGLAAAAAALAIGALIAQIEPRRAIATRPFESFVDPSG